MRDDEFAWEPYGPAMSMSVDARLDSAGRIRRLELSGLEATRIARGRAARGGVNLLAAWHLAEPFNPATPAPIPLPAGGGDRNAIAIYDIPQEADDATLHSANAGTASRRCARLAPTPTCLR